MYRDEAIRIARRNGHTFEQIGSFYGLTRECVREICAGVVPYPSWDAPRVEAVPVEAVATEPRVEAIPAVRTLRPNELRDEAIRFARSDGRTLAEISREYGITRERVRQICEGLVVMRACSLCGEEFGTTTNVGYCDSCRDCDTCGEAIHKRRRGTSRYCSNACDPGHRPKVLKGRSRYVSTGEVGVYLRVYIASGEPAEARPYVTWSLGSGKKTLHRFATFEQALAFRLSQIEEPTNCDQRNTPRARRLSGRPTRGQAQAGVRA